MKIFHNPAHAGHDGASELKAGALGRCHDNSDRFSGLIPRLAAAGHDLAVPKVEEAALMAAILRVHDADYVDFLKTVWADWVAARGTPEGGTPDALPLVWEAPGLRRPAGLARIRPETVEGRLSYHAIDAGTPITAGMWAAVRESAGAALAAVDCVLGGARAAFALVRPPGHHAGRDFYGGYGFLNNAAIAAAALRAGGAKRVAVLDVDYHHGNGTQAIFYDRADVLYVSLHADPRTEYPFFLGHGDERGAGAGAGFNRNLPLPKGTAWPAYAEALEAACAEIAGFRAEALVLSYGFDAYEGDALGTFRLKTADFTRLSERVAALGNPSVLVMEGGYAPGALPGNVLAALEGFAA